MIVRQSPVVSQFDGFASLVGSFLLFHALWHVGREKQEPAAPSRGPKGEKHPANATCAALMVAKIATGWRPRRAWKRP